MERSKSTWIKTKDTSQRNIPANHRIWTSKLLVVRHCFTIPKQCLENFFNVFSFCWSKETKLNKQNCNIEVSSGARIKMHKATSTDMIQQMCLSFIQQKSLCTLLDLRVNICCPISGPVIYQIPLWKFFRGFSVTASRSCFILRNKLKQQMSLRVGGGSENPVVNSLWTSLI